MASDHAETTVPTKADLLVPHGSTCHDSDCPDHPDTDDSTAAPAYWNYRLMSDSVPLADTGDHIETVAVVEAWYDADDNLVGWGEDVPLVASDLDELGALLDSLRNLIVGAETGLVPVLHKPPLSASREVPDGE